jgi:hypothetical protein
MSTSQFSPSATWGFKWSLDRMDGRVFEFCTFKLHTLFEMLIKALKWMDFYKSFHKRSLKERCTLIVKVE